MDQSTAEQALRQLEPLVGEWTFEAKWPDGKPGPGGGRGTFLVAGSGIRFEDRGLHELRGVPEAWQLYRVVP